MGCPTHLLIIIIEFHQPHPNQCQILHQRSISAYFALLTVLYLFLSLAGLILLLLCMRLLEEIFRKEYIAKLQLVLRIEATILILCYDILLVKITSLMDRAVTRGTTQRYCQAKDSIQHHLNRVTQVNNLTTHRINRTIIISLIVIKQPIIKVQIQAQAQAQAVIIIPIRTNPITLMLTLRYRAIMVTVSHIHMGILISPRLTDRVKHIPQQTYSASPIPILPLR